MVVGRPLPDEDTRVGAPEVGGGEAAVFEGRVGDFEEEPLLRVYCLFFRNQ